MPSNFHPHRDIIRAWADGAEIDWYSQKEGRWIPCLDQGLSTPSFNKDTAYRVRPENKVYVAWLSILDGDIYTEECQGSKGNFLVETNSEGVIVSVSLI